MITAGQRNASAALDPARAAVVRLDASRGSEDLAADLIDVWTSIEASLRALVGSTVLAGQALIREARQRQLIDFDAANSLAAFEAVDGRLQNVAYRPTESDVAAAHVALDKLELALTDRPAAEAGRPVVPAQPLNATAPAVPAPTVPVRSPGMPGWGKGAIVVAVVVVIIVGGYFVLGHRGPSSLQQGVDAYRAGQRELAVNDFNKAERDDPKSPLPHVYLGRMAREVGNFTLASQELTLALQADPASEIALREMGANELAQSQYELARRFYVRAVQADPTDMTAQGYLGCTLVKLGRPQDAAGFLSRAGQGPWSNCTPAAPGSTAGAPAGPGALSAPTSTATP